MVSAEQPPLKAVILCATFIKSPLSFARPWMASLLHPFLFKFRPSNLACRRLLGENADAELKSRLLEVLQVPSADTLASRARAILCLDAKEALRATKVPLLYLQGRDD